jgi:hypothetical protein
MSNKFNALISVVESKRKIKGNFLFNNRQKIGVEREPQENILIESKQEKVLMIQLKDGKVINIITIEKCESEKFAEIEIKKKFDVKMIKLEEYKRIFLLKKCNDDLSFPERSRC